MMLQDTQQPYEVEIVNSFGVGTARYCSCWPSPLIKRRTPQSAQGYRLREGLHGCGSKGLLQKHN